MADSKILVQCPKCAERMRFSDLFIGRNGVCPSCGECFLIMPPEPDPGAHRVNMKPPSTRSRAQRFHISTYFKKKDAP